MTPAEDYDSTTVRRPWYLQSMAPGPDLETTLRRGGLDVHVEHYQPSADARLSLVMVHGFSAHCGLYPHVGRALAGNGIAVTQFDGRGHGKSGGRRGHVDDFADYLDDLAMIIAWARERNPDLPWAIMGHSFGGAVVLAFTLDEKRIDKPSRLVAVAPYLKLKMNVSAPKRMATTVAARVLPTFSASNGLRGEEISRNPKVVDGFWKDPLIFHQATAGWFMATLRAQAHLRTHAERLKVPTLMLLAGEDRIVANEANLAFARSAGEAVAVKTYDGLFHELLLEPEAPVVIQDIGHWLVSPLPHKQTA
jgi:alpha-beta hydrolase superfamily lysophospholipase